MKTLHEVYVNTLIKKIKYKPLHIYQNDSAEYIDFIFDTDVVDCDIQIKALLPNGKRLAYVLKPKKLDITVEDESDSEEEEEAINICKHLWHIPSELLEINGYVVLEIKILSTDGVTTIGTFGINVLEVLFNDITGNEIMPTTDNFVVDSMVCY